jgi:hypothetical protein
VLSFTYSPSSCLFIPFPSRRELLLFAIFVGLGRTANSDPERHTNNAMAVFSFFLFVLYAVFSACLFCFRHYVIGADARRGGDGWFVSYV